MIPLDEALRPTRLFGATVHEGCDRAGYYEQGQFATEYTDDLVSGLLIVHDLHPLSTAERVRMALEGVRPYPGLHDGGVELLDVEPSGVVRLRLTGACDGCPSSQATITAAIERAIAAAAPETTGVEVETDEKPGPLLQIGARPPGPCPVAE